MKPTKIHDAVKEHYGELALAGQSCCPQQNLLYLPEIVQEFPGDIVDASAGSGDPVTPAALKPGETVLDLGSGAGLDCFLAARQVGDGGRVIGVDMTPAMLARARSNARRLNISNVEFREGFLESLPVEDESVDVVISNCVINLAPDKNPVFRELRRVLKNGGRISVSDILTNHPPAAAQESGDKDWCGCTSGALTAREYTDALAGAGFVDIRITPNLDLIEKAFASGQLQVQSRSGKPVHLTRDELLEKVRNWEGLAGKMYVPHLVSARKPG
ncbi:MAG: methyltransferase domain-containing protein [Chloroflexi bacterium]|nr:methyltransferase domain-containing protein [Chloroflexota bacterium]